MMSKDIDKKYKDWAEKIINKLTNTLQDEKGRKFVLKKPINTIYILNRKDYEYTSLALCHGWRRVEPSFESYKEYLLSASMDDVKLFYSKQPTVIKEFTPSFWRRGWDGKERRILEDISIAPYEGYIFLCPDLIQKRVNELLPRLHELKNQDIEFSLFRIILLHEMGHQYSYGNLPSDQLSILQDNEDGNMSEGLANWFAFQFCTREERWILAESTVDQKPCYRYYYILRYADISPLLDSLINRTIVYSALQEFAKIVGSRLILGGGMISVRERVYGTIMDWSGKGGKILAGESIQLLGPMMSGCIVTPKIEVLFGRFPKNTLIVTNEITRIEDYGKLPPNIIILPKDKVDISAIIRSHWNDKSEECLKAILADLGLSDKWSV